jgi:hypothetical protein
MVSFKKILQNFLKKALAQNGHFASDDKDDDIFIYLKIKLFVAALFYTSNNSSKN